MDWEFQFLNWIQENWHNDVLTTVLRWITTLGNGGILWILLSLLLWIPRKTRKCGISMSLSLLLCGILGNLILKPWIGRIRPYDINTSIELLLPALSDFSFPSGHTYAAFAGAITLFIFYKKSGIAALILACLIAFSRLYFYVHFPNRYYGRYGDGDPSSLSFRMAGTALSLAPLTGVVYSGTLGFCIKHAEIGFAHYILS